MRKGKNETVPVLLFSPKFLGLLDWFLHKAPYWSVHNYEKRVDPQVRSSFLRLVEEARAANEDEFAGMTIHGSTETPHAMSLMFDVLRRSLGGTRQSNGSREEPLQCQRQEGVQ